MASVLIVEDEGILAFKTRIDLERMGHEVVGIAANGDNAIQIAEMKNPDIVLMDIVLQGGKSGIETSGIICENFGCRIVYMTAHTDELTVQAAKSTRHAGFLHKPFEPFQLNQALIEAMK